MYIRQYVTKNPRTGAKYVNHKLVEGVQTDFGSRQRIIMPLGRLEIPKEQWKQLAKILADMLSGQQFIFDTDVELAELARSFMANFQSKQESNSEAAEQDKKRNLATIDVDSLTTTNHRSVGAELVALATWDKLRFDAHLKDCGFDPQEIFLAKAVIIGRLIKPGSDLACWRWISAQTTLPELASDGTAEISKDAIYAIADKLYGIKDKLELKLRRQLDNLFDKPTVYLFDLTNTYFEGQCKNNVLAQFGHSKEKRTDCRLVALAVITDEYGLPVYSQIYSGNQSEPETLLQILDKVEPTQLLLLGDTKPTIVMDRGIATRANIELLISRDIHYLVVERRNNAKDYIAEFANNRESFEIIERSNQQKVYLKKLPAEPNKVLVISEGKRLKELAINEKLQRRFIDDANRLKKSIEKGTVKLLDKINRKIGRLQERHGHIAPYYNLTLQLNDDQKSAETLLIEALPISEERNVLDGCYVIETSHVDMEAEKIWQLYVSLTRVESAFRALKTDLGFRPVHHQLAERTSAHLFISVLAYYLLSTVERSLHCAGDHRRWSTIKDILSTHQRSTIIFTDENKQIYHVRVNGQPEPVHLEIYKSLNIRPSSLRTKKKIFRRLL